ncbi:MAG: hypothetical protein WCI05_19430 [Myxococcales bacterium]
MSLPITLSSSRSEVRDHLVYVQEVLEKHTALDKERTVEVPSTFAKQKQRIAAIASRYEEPFRLAVLGEFKSGKSSLLNVILGTPELLPEGIVTTRRTRHAARPDAPFSRRSGAMNEAGQ